MQILMPNFLHSFFDVVVRCRPSSVSSLPSWSACSFMPETVTMQISGTKEKLLPRLLIVVVLLALGLLALGLLVLLASNDG
jgi:hypothetical protein